MANDGGDLLFGENDRNVRFSFGADGLNVAGFLFQYVPEKEQKSVERLVLGGRDNLFFHRQESEEVFVIVVFQLFGRFAVDEGLKFDDPVGVSFEGFWGIMPNADFVGKGGMGLVPRGNPMLGGAAGWRCSSMDGAGG